ncbi:MAG: hypothetical protein ACREGF_00485 [Candidatus Saccharimonadales bacterium]
MIQRSIFKTALLGGAVLMFAGVMLATQLAHGSAPYVGNRFDQMSSSAAGASATHLLGFTINTVGASLGSIEFQFCSNNPLPLTPCSAPSGLDASGAVLAHQSGNTGFSLSPLTTANNVILSRTPATPPLPGVPSTYQLDNIINPASGGSYYIRIYIYPTSDASGAPSEVGGVAIAINGGLNVSAVVPPYLKFCAGTAIRNYDCSTATAYLVDFGNFSPARSSSGSSQFVVATNAGGGYTVTVSGSTLTSGNNIISPLARQTPAAPGNSQFGLNLRANNFPVVGANPTAGGSGQISSNYNLPDFFMYKDGDRLVSSSGVSDNQTFTLSYLANVSHSDPPGVYVTTLTYICLANF